MSRTSSTLLRRLALLPAFGLGLGFGACTLANPNHCFNLAVDTNAWCAAVHPDEPYCSPCAAENNGCVAEEPSDCPSYTAPATGTGTGTDSGTGGETGTDTGGETGTDTGGTG